MTSRKIEYHNERLKRHCLPVEPGADVEASYNASLLAFVDWWMRRFFQVRGA